MGVRELNDYSYEDYLDIDTSTPDSERYELIFGHIFAMSGASAVHQDIVLSIATILKSFKSSKQCFPRIAPYDLKIECSGTTNVVQPDIILYCKNRDIPCAVFEVLSKSTAYKDKGVKKDLYESCGIKNYFLVDPLAKTIDKFLLKDEKYIYERCYGIDEEEDRSDIMLIESLDESIDVKDFFEEM